MRIVIALILTLLIVLAIATIASARTWYILPDGSGDAPTIQVGVDSTAAGDTVLLAAGTYTGVGNRDIDFLGKAITVTSESGRAVTIIDCQWLGCGCVFQRGEGSSSILSGVTIRNGFTESGNAICCSGSSPTISDNIISGNFAPAIFCCYGSSPTISGNIISGNSPGEAGGAIHCCWGGCPNISGNTISGNSCQRGGGIYCSGSSPAITGNTISGNTAGEGGGIWCADASPTVTGNTISSNSVQAVGGGICLYDSYATISDNTISGNSVRYFQYGGGIYCEVLPGHYGSPIIRNTIISFSIGANGIYCREGCSPTLINCDIYGNAGGDGLCGIDGGCNFSADPQFCHRWDGDFCIDYLSPCAPGHHPYGCNLGLIGAMGVGCDHPTRVENTTWGRIKAMFR